MDRKCNKCQMPHQHRMCGCNHPQLMCYRSWICAGWADVTISQQNQATAHCQATGKATVHSSCDGRAAAEHALLETNPAELLVTRTPATMMTCSTDTFGDLSSPAKRCEITALKLQAPGGEGQPSLTPAAHEHRSQFMPESVSALNLMYVTHVLHLGIGCWTVTLAAYIRAKQQARPHNRKHSIAGAFSCSDQHPAGPASDQTPTGAIRPTAAPESPSPCRPPPLALHLPQSCLQNLAKIVKEKPWAPQPVLHQPLAVLPWEGDG